MDLESLPIPLAGIVALAVAGYVLLVLLILLTRYCLYAQGVFQASQKDGEIPPEQCCASCCQVMMDCCTCQDCSIRTLLNSICPHKKLSCEECVTCQYFRGISYGANEGVNWVCCDTGGRPR